MNPTKPANEMKIVEVIESEGSKGFGTGGKDLGRTAHQEINGFQRLIKGIPKLVKRHC